MADDFSPRYVGDTADTLQCTFVDHGGAVYPILGATNLTMKLKNTSSGTVTTGSGTFNITDGAGGKVEYIWAASDVANPGTYEVSVSMALDDGSTKHFDWRLLEILPAI